MIEVNLSPRLKDNQLANLGGLNLSLINVRMLVISLLVLYVFEPFFVDHFDGEIKTIDDQAKNIQKEQRIITTKLVQLRDIKKQVEDLNRQELELSQRISVVQKIVDKRQNPFKVFKYIAENTPEDVWINELQLDEKKLTLKGYSKSWKSIADFLENLKSSVFFVEGISYDKPKDAESAISGHRVEPFVITATVEKFK